MFKKLVLFSLLCAVILAFAACRGAEPTAPAAQPADSAPGDTAPDAQPADSADSTPADTSASADDWKIGIITGTVSQGEEEHLAALRMVELFGSDRVITATYPDNFQAEMEVTIANVMSLADQGARAIVIVQGVPGSIAAIERTREVYGDEVFFFTGVPQEPPQEIASISDITMMSDEVTVGRAIMEQAKKMGAENFVHISFPRHLGMETIAVRRALLMETAEELGINFIEQTAPDPSTEGVPVAQMFISENVPRWIEEYGPNTAFFNTNCGMQEPLIRQIAEYGGLYPLQCCPSPFHALPAAMNISLDGNEGDVDFLINALTEAFADAGATGRFSTWPVPVNMMLVEVGTRYSIEYLEGNVGRHDRDALMRIVNEVAASYNSEVEVSNWHLSDGTELDNFYMVLSDFVNF